MARPPHLCAPPMWHDWRPTRDAAAVRCVRCGLEAAPRYVYLPSGVRLEARLIRERLYMEIREALQLAEAIEERRRPLTGPLTVMIAGHHGAADYMVHGIDSCEEEGPIRVRVEAVMSARIHR